MRFMNDYDIEMSKRQYAGFPNLQAGAQALDNLREWTDGCSDGWAYWPKPCRAASRLMEALEDPDRRQAWLNGTLEDIDEKELKRLLTPIKSFLTRQGAKPSEVLG